MLKENNKRGHRTLEMWATAKSHCGYLQEVLMEPREKSHISGFAP